MLMFDNLHDPDPPRPGVREFALVAERAQGIRRRRAAWTVRAACVAILVGAGLTIVAASNRTETVTSDTVTSERTTSDGATPNPSTTRPAVTATAGAATASTLGLDAAQAASALPPVALGPGLLTISDDPLVEIFEAADGRTCTEADVVVSTPNCAPAGAGFVVVGFGEVDAARVAFVVDPTVNVGIDAPTATCTQTFPDFAVVQVWVCAGLDVDTATVEIQAADRIVIRA